MIQEFTLLRLEYNTWNGLIFSVIGLEISGEKIGFEGDLLGLHIGNKHVILSVLFIDIEFKNPFIT